MKLHQKKIRNLFPVICVGILYLIAFYFLENREVSIHIIQTKLDYLIPFCEYFIIPYLLWFFYVTATVVYFACFQEDKEEYKRLCISLLTGMIVFLVLSFFYPNGQNLRPVLEGKNIFERMVLRLYATDTPTNILPSLHVFYSTVCCIALVNNDRIKRNQFGKVLIYVLTGSIILSTMFLKQHSTIDVVMALLMNGTCYQLFYKQASNHSHVGTMHYRTRHKRKGIEL